MLQFRSRTIVIGITLAFAFLAQAAAADDRSWQALDRLRSQLEERSPLAVNFTQTLVPEGFGPEDGESESGHLLINLPSCLRWDYLGEFEKSFLLCDKEGYYWNPGETVGSLFSLDGQEDAPGLDFFLRPVSLLKTRYQATSQIDDDRITIDLVPAAPTEDVVALRLVLERASGLLVSMSYDDVDANRSIFELSNYRDHEGMALFRPPEDVSWERN